MKTVFFDVDTQIDFVFPAGALYVPGAEGILPLIGRLNRFATGNNIAVVSTMDAHSENDPEFLHWPPHCVVGCNGQRKPAQTLVESQILLEKQTFDCFSNPNLLGLLAELGAERYVVYGVVTEICVKMAAFGLLKTGARVEVVSDAVRSLKSEAAETMLAEFRAAGGAVTDIGAVLGG
ncbi:MAG: isochorismatase family cysteine hydrolase [Bryobacteraceae bacterium]